MPLEKDYVQQQLANKDINSKFNKDDKVVVDKENKAAAKRHLKKIGFGHVQVVSEQAISFTNYLKNSAEEITEDEINLEDYTLEELTEYLESEELDEISKEVLGSYIKKASQDKGQADHRRGLNTGFGVGKDEDDDLYNKSKKRYNGIVKAVAKISK